MSVTIESGGICAPNGFQAAGLHCGIAKKPGKKDLALIYSKVPCAAAAVYTTNKVQAGPILVTKEHMADKSIQAVVVNSGNANACCASSEEDARRMSSLAARALNLPEGSVAVASTGVIGQALPVEKIEAAMPELKLALTAQGSGDAVAAIMTTDVREKEIAVSFQAGGRRCAMGGIAKGSGMIHPNMATMLAFITTDVDIAPHLLERAMDIVVSDTFNMISVDGDTSTNDMALILANGLAGNARIQEEGEDFSAFTVALMHVCIYLARLMAKDGEGATKLLECTVTGARSEQDARVLARGVISSSLFKAAMFGADANWGRVLCAMGYSGGAFDPAKVDVSFASRAGSVAVCKEGGGLPFSEEEAKKILSEDEIEIQIDLRQGEGKAVAWGCDLTYDYVKINGDYRS